MPSLLLSSSYSHFFLTTLKPPNPFSFPLMKDRPPPSSYGAIYIPPHHRLRSPVGAATNYNSTTPVGSNLRDSGAPLLNPRLATTTQPHSQTPIQKQLPKGSSHYVSAYDDGISEEGSDREFESATQPVRLFIHIGDNSGSFFF